MRTCNKRPRFLGSICFTKVSTVLSLCLVTGIVHAESFKFSWKIPSKAIVECSVTKQGYTSHNSWTLRLEAAENPELYNLSISDPKLIAIEGVPSPQAQEMMNNPIFRATEGLIPNLVIDNEGLVKEVGSILPMIRKILAEIDDPKEAEQIGSFLTSPAIVQSLEARAASYWDSWVGTYIGLDLNAGEKREFSVPMTLGSHEIPVKMSIEHLGYKNQTNLAHIRIISTLQGPEYNSFIMESITRSFQQLGTPGSQEPKFKSSRKETTINAVIDPKTLYPIQVDRIERDRIIFDDAAAGGTQSTVNNCSFTWLN